MEERRSGGNAPRHIYGPRAVGNVLPGLMRPALRKRGASLGSLLADWEAVVGPVLARTTTPRRLFAGTLAIVCTGPVAMELQHQAPQVMARINTHLGRVAVTRLRFVQDSDAAPLPALAPKPPAMKAASRAVAGLPAGELRDALERLGRVVLTERAAQPPSKPEV